MARPAWPGSSRGIGGDRPVNGMDEPMAVLDWIAAAAIVLGALMSLLAGIGRASCRERV